MTAAGVDAFKWGLRVPEIGSAAPLHVAVPVEWSRTIVDCEIMFIPPETSGTTKLGSDGLYAARAGR
jgi:hypothetical protein